MRIVQSSTLLPYPSSFLGHMLVSQTYLVVEALRSSPNNKLFCATLNVALVSDYKTGVKPKCPQTLPGCLWRDTFLHRSNDTLDYNNIIQLSFRLCQTLLSKHYNLLHTRGPWQWQFRTQLDWREPTGGRHCQYERSCRCLRVGVPQGGGQRNTR